MFQNHRLLDQFPVAVLRPVAAGLVCIVERRPGGSVEHAWVRACHMLNVQEGLTRVPHRETPAPFLAPAGGMIPIRPLLYRYPIGPRKAPN